MKDGLYVNCRYPHLTLLCLREIRIYSCTLCKKDWHTTYIDTKTWKRFHDVHTHGKKQLTLPWDNIVWGKDA